MIMLHARLEKRPKPHARKTAQGRAQESTNAGELLLEFGTTSIFLLYPYYILGVLLWGPDDVGVTGPVFRLNPGPFADVAHWCRGRLHFDFHWPLNTRKDFFGHG